MDRSINVTRRSEDRILPASSGVPVCTQPAVQARPGRGGSWQSSPGCAHHALLLTRDQAGAEREFRVLRATYRKDGCSQREHSSDNGMPSHLLGYSGPTAVGSSSLIWERPRNTPNLSPGQATLWALTATRARKLLLLTQFKNRNC